MITIIDYGAGNIKSIQNMLKRLGVNSSISSSIKDVEKANKLILPGVGHFDHGMKNLKASGYLEVLNHKVKQEKCPILGICLGAQLMGNVSQEGNELGLGWIDMEIVKFDKSKLEAKLKIPHMGWNKVNRRNEDREGLFKDLEADARFYFVHAYHMLPKHESNVIGSTTYGYEFVSAVQKDNIYGVQFHPEKSHVFGMQIMRNFANL